MNDARNRRTVTAVPPPWSAQEHDDALVTLISDLLHVQVLCQQAKGRTSDPNMLHAYALVDLKAEEAQAWASLCFLTNSRRKGEET